MVFSLGGGEVTIEHEKSFVAHHLKAVDYFESTARDIETEYEEELWHDLPTDTRDEYSICTTSGVIRSVAFLEATINEMIRRITVDEPPTSGYMTHPQLRTTVDPEEARGLIQDRIPTLDKFDELLSDSGEKPIPTGEGTGQQTKAVIDLRNHFIHYESEMLPPDELPEAAACLPKEVRWSNPFETEQMDPIDRCLGSKMIEWATDSCFKYAEEFFDRLDIESDISPDAQPLERFAVDENPARPYIVVLDQLDHSYR